MQKLANILCSLLPSIGAYPNGRAHGNWVINSNFLISQRDTRESTRESAELDALFQGVHLEPPAVAVTHVLLSRLRRKMKV